MGLEERVNDSDRHLNHSSDIVLSNYYAPPSVSGPLSTSESPLITPFFNCLFSGYILTAVAGYLYERVAGSAPDHDLLVKIRRGEQ